MTQAQWIYYFATEMVKAMPSMSLSQAVALGRDTAQEGEPEGAARALAIQFCAAGTIA